MSVYSPLQIGFVHIPKTGGTSVARWMLDNIPGTIKYSTDHYSASMLLDKHPNIDMLFTIVRNPWARVVSTYRFVFNPTNTQRISQKLDVDITPMPFDQFVYEGLDHKSNLWYNTATPQTRWFDRNIHVVLRQETLAEDFKQIQEMFNCSVPLPHTNKHNHDNNQHYTLFYNDKTKKRVAELFGEDIERFKYEFDR